MAPICPGLVPLAVTRPEVFRLGGATGRQCTHQSHSTTRLEPRQAVGMPRVLVIDSYDSFVYNLVQYLGELGAEPVVVRNDEWTVERALEAAPDLVLLSPGPEPA